MPADSSITSTRLAAAAATPSETAATPNQPASETAATPNQPGQAGAPESSSPTPLGPPSLSPSRAADFKTCPLLYRFRSIDRIPEQPTQDQARGTLVHAVLEHLFDLPPAQRTLTSAAALIEPQWQRLMVEQDGLAQLFQIEDSQGSADFLGSATALLNGYFAVEDPSRLTPAQREFPVQALLDDGLLIRGYIDRLDETPAGDLRVVDYKTGGAPREAFEGRALFQLKFYALVLWRTRGVIPRSLRLIYLRDAEACDYSPDEQELARFERTVIALWHAIERATKERDFRPKPSSLCAWCAHQSRCPAFGGVPPEFPSQPPTGGGHFDRAANFDVTANVVPVEASSTT